MFLPPSVTLSMLTAKTRSVLIFGHSPDLAEIAKRAKVSKGINTSIIKTPSRIFMIFSVFEQLFLLNSNGSFLLPMHLAGADHSYYGVFGLKKVPNMFLNN